MKKVKFSIACIAMYNAELEVEDNLTEEEILEKIHENLDTFPVQELTWLEDFAPETAVTIDDIRSIEAI